MAETTSATPGAGTEDPAEPSSRRRRRVVVGLVVLAVVAWLVTCGIVLVGAAGHASKGQDLVKGIDSLRGGDIGHFVAAVRGGSDSGAQRSGTGGEHGRKLAADLRAASREFDRAHQSASSAVLTPLTWLPIVGTQVKSVRDLSAAASTVGSAAADAVDSVAGQLDSATGDPAARAAAARSASDALARFQKRTANLGLGPLANLVPPLAKARDEFSARLADLDARMATLVPASRGVSKFLAGPTSEVFFAANNAEMRAGSGMFLQASSLGVADGAFDFGPFEATDNMVLATEVPNVDNDFDNMWGRFEPGKDWRNLNLTPRFPVSAELATKMWAASGRGDATGVVVVDVYALVDLLEVVGPVQVTSASGQTVTVDSGNVVHYLLLQQYQDFGSDRDARRDSLGGVASAVLQAFNTRQVSAADLITAVQRAGRGGHLRAWSSDPVEQAAWEALGVDGDPVADTFAVSLMNRGGNKLDQFVDVSTKVTRRDTFSAGVPMNVTVTVANHSPAGLPAYVGGPYPGTDAVAGEYWGFLQVTLPGGSTYEPGNQEVVAKGPDGPTEAFSVWVDVKAGETGTYSFDVVLPAGVSSLEVPPMARPPKALYDVLGRKWVPDRPKVVSLG